MIIDIHFRQIYCESPLCPPARRDSDSFWILSNSFADPLAASSTPLSAGVSSRAELEEIEEEEEIIDEDFIYYGSRDGEIEDDFDYGLWDACHDIADEYEEKFFRGRKNSRRTLNQTLRHKQADKRERINPARLVSRVEVEKREKRDSNVEYHNEIRKSKSSRKYSHMIPIPPWMIQSSDPVLHGGAALNGRLNPQSRIEEERQLSLAIQQSLQTARSSSSRSHASGLSMQQILELTTRELTPEDYELLLLLDDSVQKKTISKADFRTKFTHCTLSCDGPSDEPCIVCFNSFLKGEKQTELPCSHKYHSHCIEQWLTQSGTKCPLCGVSLDN